ncbi:NFX1-type zinc finger-containing protein 1-like isoform X2 [Homalodisca vitripennis]|uniref:NFX1-type zinc finger-containing protein 1-like isoform X2 n=1 Tax=Homalodisca vitripennis TaxID=197043 RepID=UPI001EEC182F|nr:NFX1-type zinc finger-containing protein 1-like isoform X2 [Homalodisca vitripennis]
MSHKGAKSLSKGEGSSSSSNPRGGALSDAFFQAVEQFKNNDDEEWRVQKRRKNRQEPREVKHFGRDQSRDLSSEIRERRHSKSSESYNSKKVNNQKPSQNSCKTETEKGDYNNSFDRQKHQKSSQLQSSKKNSSSVTDSTKKKNEHCRDDFKFGFSFSKLNELSAKDSTDIIRTLANSRSGLDTFLTSNIKPDFMYLIIKILSKLTTSDWEENKEHVLMKATPPEFFKKISEFVVCLVSDEQSFKRCEEMESFFDNLLTFFRAIMTVLPTVAAEHLMGPLRVTKMAMENVAAYQQNVTINANLFEKLKELIVDFEERKKEKEERDRVIREKIEPVYPKPLVNISDIPVYPRPEDIACAQGLIVPNKIKGCYKNVEDYLNVQFHLLREDFIAPLRQGIHEFRTGHDEKKNKKKTKINNIRIYNRVKFLKPKVIADKVGYDICFDPEKRLRVKWEYSKRFIFGSLLLFTTDNFHSFFLATVVKRDLSILEKDRIVSVILCDTSELAQDILSKEFLMAESEIYFEPYYSVLKALQKFDNNSFPMKKYFVDVETKTDPPAYTRNGSDVYSISIGDGGINGRFTIKLFEPHTWPACEELGFDSSQLTAFKAALTNDLVVIQGPPGTGKTYLGLKIAAALLENSVIWNYDHKTPILVICYTNHALDQFLEGIVQNNLTNNIVRIGGRSKSELLGPFNLRERRKSVAYFSPNFYQAALLKDLKREMSEIFENIKILQDNLEHLDKNDGILSLKTLKIVMSETHQTYFKNNDHVLEWLLLGVSDQGRSQKNLISTYDKGVRRRQTENVLDDFGFDLADFENVRRLKEVFFDRIDLDEANQHTNANIQIFFSYTFEEIQKKIEHYEKIFESLPNSEDSREMIQQKMHEAKQAESGLKLILNHFVDKLTNIGIPTEDDTRRLFKVENINALNSNERWVLYKIWIEFLKSGYWMMLGKLEERYRRGARRYDEVRQFDDLRIVQQADVVGVTTTTAARLQAMLRELKPKIVIVEEAAEVLEAHIVASLSVYCQHLILIGDHKQLRPSPSEYKLGKDYHLDVSLFERLINNGVNFHTLKIQHRMRPEISRLIVPTIYPTLCDHPSTLCRQKVRGMDKSVFFMNHNHYEAEVDDIMSKKNLFEARMIMLLARHLLLQGYRPDEITVLTTYSGQMFLMKEEQNRLELPKDLLVTVVDNFQGEENKIILLSLVRSNTENRIGFMKIENRVCVALSRARDGLYVVGNMDCLESESVLWQRIRQSFVDQGAFGPALVLQCERHKHQLTRIVDHTDFNTVPEGGCSQACGERLPCGHNCKSLCHVSTDRHTRYRCSEPCNRFLCEERHPCTKKCYQKCDKCLTPMDRVLDCGHHIILQCCVEYRKLQCKEMVTISYTHCDHKVQLECYRKGHKTCPQPCPFRLECGHACTRTCHVLDDPDHLEYKCEKPCARRPLGCTTESHRCQNKCHEECGSCKTMVVKLLPCGHKLTVPCQEKTLVCKVPCVRKLSCGHPCDKLCYEDCGKCYFKVEKVVPLCGHKVQVKCYKDPTKEHCRGQCSVTLQCGHKCAKRCCDSCSQDDCVVPTQLSVALPCGHKGVMLPCNLTRKINFVDSTDKEQLVQYCSEPCLQMLDCKHRCSGTCGQCMQGRIHKVCEEDCGNTLICGHSCPVPCREVCPPCQKPCQNKCVHTKCPKKCGEPCIPCKEPCDYQCIHSRCTKKCGDLCDRKPCTEPCYLSLPCSHPCVGFCGEPCPPCKQCFPEHYEEFFFTGEETEEDAKWVLLNDCKHVIEVTGLETWLGMDQEGSEIKLKACPKCRHTEPNRYISTTQRYLNEVKRTFIDIQAVKQKIFGQVEEIRNKRKELLKEISKISPKEMEGFNNEDQSEDKLKTLRESLLVELKYVKNKRRNEISTHKASLLNFMASIYLAIQERVVNDWKNLTEANKKKAFKHVNFYITILNQRKEKISEEEILSFNREVDRLHRIFDLLLLESTANFLALASFNADIQKKVREFHVDLKQKIYSLKPYNESEDKEVKEILKEVSKKLNTVVSDEERRMVHRAMATSFNGGERSTNRWYRCGGCRDVYCVANCGAINQIAKCGRCGHTIGDQSRIRNEEMARALQNIH